MEQPQEINEDEEDLTRIFGFSGRCTFVLTALLSLLLIYPSFVDWAWGRVALALLFSAIIVAIAYAVGHSRRQLIAAWAFATVIFGLQVAYFSTGSQLLFGTGILLVACFMVFAIAQLFAYLMRRGPITGDKLHAALAIYILGAFFWAALYTFVSHANPGSFLVNTARGGVPDFYDMLYLSFTTLTSTGFGDLTPATRRAESLVILEQIAGVFYVAVLIARLAGLYPAGAAHPK